MADNHDTLDFFGRLENRLALVATMNAAQGQRLDRFGPVDPAVGELCNELGALRVDVAAAVDELRKLARHVAAVEALTLPAAALAQQMQADAQTRANVVADRRTWPATWADGLAAVDSRRAGDLDQAGARPAVDLSALPGLRDMAEDLAARMQTINGASDLDTMQATELAHRLRHLVDGRPAGASMTDEQAHAAQRMEVARQLLELRRQGRLLDAQELAGSDLLEQAELQAQALANLANAPALVSLDVLDEISARGQAMLGRLRRLVDTDARAAQTPVYSVLGPLGLIR